MPTPQEMQIMQQMLAQQTGAAQTPQQKMAQVLMQPQPIANDPNGQYSPMQGMAQLANGAVQGMAINKYMGQPQQPQLTPPFGLGANIG
jgi:hypothetical protein